MAEGVWGLFRKLPNGRTKAVLSDWYKRRLRERLCLDLPGGLRMELEPWEWSQNQIRRNGESEPLTAAALRGLLKPGGLFVDVGAHVGYLSLVARQAIGRDGLVVAIEPQPHNAALLLANWQHNDFTNIVCYAAACGETEEFVTLHVQPFLDRTRLSLSGPSVPGDLAQTFVAPVVRLDRVLEREAPGRPFVAKLDVEGWELPALKGLGSAANRAEALVVEITDPREAAALRCVEWLQAQGLALTTIEGRSWNGHDPLPENNLLATRPSGRVGPSP